MILVVLIIPIEHSCPKKMKQPDPVFFTQVRHFVEILTVVGFHENWQQVFTISDVLALCNCVECPGLIRGGDQGQLRLAQLESNGNQRYDYGQDTN